MDIYDKIESLLAQHGIDRKKMCEKTNIPYSTFTNMVNRRSSRITVDNIQSIAKFFGVTTDYLLRDSVTNPRGLVTDLQNDETSNNFIELHKVSGINENKEYFEFFVPSNIREIIEALADMPEESLDELKSIMEYVKFKYGKDQF